MATVPIASRARMASALSNTNTTSWSPCGSTNMASQKTMPAGCESRTRAHVGLHSPRPRTFPAHLRVPRSVAQKTNRRSLAVVSAQRADGTQSAGDEMRASTSGSSAGDFKSQAAPNAIRRSFIAAGSLLTALSGASALANPMGIVDSASAHASSAHGSAIDGGVAMMVDVSSSAAGGLDIPSPESPRLQSKRVPLQNEIAEIAADPSQLQAAGSAAISKVGGSFGLLASGIFGAGLFSRRSQGSGQAPGPQKEGGDENRPGSPRSRFSGVVSATVAERPSTSPSSSSSSSSSLLLLPGGNGGSGEGNSSVPGTVRVSVGEWSQRDHREVVDPEVDQDRGSPSDLDMDWRKAIERAQASAEAAQNWGKNGEYGHTLEQKQIVMLAQELEKTSKELWRKKSELMYTLADFEQATEMLSHERSKTATLESEMKKIVDSLTSAKSHMTQTAGELKQAQAQLQAEQENRASLERELSQILRVADGTLRNIESDKKKISQLTEDLNRSTHTVKALEEKVLKLEASLVQTQEHLAEAKAELLHLTSELAEAKRQLAFEMGVNQKLNADLDEAFTAMKSFEEKAGGLEAMLTAAHDTLRKERDELIANVTNLNAATQMLTAEREVTQRLRAELDAASVATNVIAKDKEEVFTALEQKLAEERRAAEAQLVQERTEKEKLYSELAVLSASQTTERMQMMEKMLHATESALITAKDELIAAVGNLRLATDMIVEEQELSTTVIDRLQKSNEQVADLRDRVQDLEGSLYDTRAQLEITKNDLRAALTNLADTFEQLEKERQRSHGLSTDLDHARAALMDARQACERAENSSRGLETALQTTRQQLFDTLSGLEKQLSEERQSKWEMSKELESSKAGMWGLEEKVKGLEAKLVETSRQLEWEKHELHQLTMKYNSTAALIADEKHNARSAMTELENARARIAEFEFRTKEVNEQLYREKDTVSRLGKELEESRGKTGNLEGLVAHLESSLAASNTRVGEETESKQQVERRLMEAVADLDKQRGHSHWLEQQLNETRGSVNNLEGNVMRLEKTLQMTTMALKTAKDELLATVANLSEATGLLQLERQENIRLTNDLVATEDAVTLLQDRLLLLDNTLVEARDVLLRDRETLQSANSKLVETQNRLRTEEEAVRSLNSELGEARAIIARLEVGLADGAINLETERRRGKALQEEVNLSRSLIMALEEREGNAQRELLALRNNDELLQTSRQLTAVKAELNSERETIKGMLADLGKSTEAMTSLESAISQLEVALSQEKQTVARLSVELEAANAERAQLRQQVLELESRLAATMTALHASEEKVRSLEIQLSQNNASIASLEEKAKHLEMSLSEAQASYNEALAARDMERSRAQDIERQLDSTRAELSGVSHQLTNVTSELTSVKEVVAARENDVRLLDFTVAELRTLLSQRESSVRELEAAVAQRDQTLDDLQGLAESFELLSNDAIREATISQERVLKMSAAAEAKVRTLEEKNYNLERQIFEAMEQARSEAMRLVETAEDNARREAGARAELERKMELLQRDMFESSELKERVTELDSELRDIRSAAETARKMAEEEIRARASMENDLLRLRNQLAEAARYTEGGDGMGQYAVAY